MSTTSGVEDCLEIIAHLSEEEGHAHVSAIAQKLGIKMPSVTALLKSLGDKGYIQYEAYQPVTLTAAGMKIAANVIRKHQTLRDFLSQCLGLPPDHADSLACKLEHELDDVAFERLRQFVKQKTLDELGSGETGVIVGIAPALTRRLAAYGLVKGASVHLSKIAPLGDPRSFLVNGTELSLRSTEARQITIQIGNGRRLVQADGLPPEGESKKQ